MRSYQILSCVFFLFEQKTACAIRISDWSADGCSSELFIATAVRLDELRMRLIMRQKPVGIGGKAEEPAFLHGPFHRRALGGELCAPLSLCQFLLVVKSLVPDRIPPLIAAEIDIPIRLLRLPQRLARGMMGRFGGADESVI